MHGDSALFSIDTRSKCLTTEPGMQLNSTQQTLTPSNLLAFNAPQERHSHSQNFHMVVNYTITLFIIKIEESPILTHCMSIERHFKRNSHG